MIEITRALYPGHPVWPGDTPYQFELHWAMEAGSSVNVGRISGTTHLGTHLDAPWHYEARGETLEQTPLDLLVGPCQVVETRVEVIDGRFVERLQDLPPRVLFDTGQPRRWLRFPERFTYLSPEAIEILADRGVRLLGTDAPSIDPLVSKELSAHHACARRGVRILEGLALEGVAPGTYELVALPLLLEGADAAPVRAILR